MSEQLDDQNDYEYKSNRSNSQPGWLVGGILILVGLIMLFQNITGFHFMNWWALFILIPAFASFNQAYQAYQNDQRMSRHVRSNSSVGLFLSMIAAAFLFNISFNLIWPLALVAGGLALLLNSFLPN